MNTSRIDPELVAGSVLVVGMGGLGCPVALALANAGVERLILCDDDQVELGNLHRQLLYTDADVGKDKLDCAREALIARGFEASRIELVRSRILPENARDLVRAAKLVVEGADNFATKFLVADACHIERRSVVHGAAIRWTATVWSVAPEGRPCYRCLFEDLPPTRADQSCAEAGVMGPVVGLAGALMADLALRLLTAGESAAAPEFGRIYTYDGKRDRLRAVDVAARAGCPLCGDQPSIGDTQESRYTARAVTP